MVKTTQCPHCFTVYEISEEQFRVSQGKVRCGTCRERFIAKFREDIAPAEIDPSQLSIEPIDNNVSDGDMRSLDKIVEEQSQLSKQFDFDNNIQSELSIVIDDEESVIETNNIELGDTVATESQPLESEPAASDTPPSDEIVEEALLPSPQFDLSDNIHSELSIVIDDDEPVIEANNIGFGDAAATESQPLESEPATSDTPPSDKIVEAASLPSPQFDLNDNIHSEPSIVINDDEPDLQTNSIELREATLTENQLSTDNPAEEESFPKESVDPDSIPEKIVLEGLDINQAVAEQRDALIAKVLTEDKGIADVPAGQHDRVDEVLAEDQHTPDNSVTEKEDNNIGGAMPAELLAAMAGANTSNSIEQNGQELQDEILIDEVHKLIEDKIFSNDLSPANEQADQSGENTTNTEFTEPQPETAFSLRKPKRGSYIARWLGTPILLLLVLCLSASLVYQFWLRHSFDWLEQEALPPTVASTLESLSQRLEVSLLDKLGISLPVRRDLKNMHLIAAYTEPHPTRSSTTLLRVQIANRSDIAQPFPWLELSLSDEGGRLVSRRALQPRDYLHNNDTPNRILPNELKRIAIELLTFPEPTTGYELKLLDK